MEKKTKMFILASTGNKNKISLDQNIHHLLKYMKTMFIKDKLHVSDFPLNFNCHFASLMQNIESSSNFM